MSYNEYYFKTSGTTARLINLIRISSIDYEAQEDEFNAAQHSHDFIELLFVKEGWGKFFIDGIHHVIKKGDIVLIPANREHYEIAIPHQELRLDSLAFTSAGDTVFLKNSIFSAVDYYQHVTNAFDALFAECGDMSEYNNLICRNIAENLVVFLIYKIKAKAEVTYEEPPQKRVFFTIAQIKEHLDKNFFSPVKIDELAQSSCLSTGHFIRLFKNLTGKTPMQYVLDLRMDAAIMSLKYTDKPVNVICFEIGFSDISNFIRKFKEKTGTTPQNFRLCHKGSNGRK